MSVMFSHTVLLETTLGAVFFCFGTNTPTPEFCENSHEREPRSPAGTAQGFDPPLGAHRSAAGMARAVCTGVKRAAAHWRRCASAGAARAVFAGAARARRSAGRRGGRFRDAGSRSLPSGRRREAGHGRAWPREAHKDRVAGAAARGGHVAGRCGTGGFRGFPGRKRGRRGGRQGRGSCPLPGRGGRRGQNGCTQRGLCRVSGHLCDRGGGRAKKPVFAL